jgi:hypothetical protein
MDGEYFVNEPYNLASSFDPGPSFFFWELFFGILPGLKDRRLRILILR